MQNYLVVRSIFVMLTSFLVVACGGGGGGPGNSAPTANAGPDQTVDEAVIVTLDGAASSDSESSISYAWAQVSGTSVVLSNNSVARATFESPLLLDDETLTFRLTVTDTEGLTASDSVSIEVIHENLLPTADAGTPQTALASAVIELDASASSDPEGALSYQWTQISGPAITLSDSAAAMPVVEFAPSATDYSVELELTVTDSDNATATDSVTIDVGGSVSGLVRLGTIVDAVASFYRVADLDQGVVYSTTTASSSSSVPGAILVPTTSLVVDANFLDDEWYLLRVSGGESIDIDDDGNLDTTSVPFLGVASALLTGSQILAGDFRVTALSDIGFQRAANRVAANTESDTIIASLNQTAAMQISDDVNGDSVIDYRDIASWDPLIQLSSLRRVEDVANAKETIRAGGAANEVAKLGTARIGEFPGFSYPSGFGLIRKPGGSIIYTLGMNPQTGDRVLSAIDVTDADNPIGRGQLGLSDLFDGTEQVVGEFAADGDFVYLTTLNKIIVVDFSNLSVPVIAGTGDRLRGGNRTRVEVERGFAYVANSTVEIYDVSDPSQIVGVDALPDAITDVALAGDFMVVADTRRIDTYDISDPTAVQPISSLPLNRDAAAVFVEGEVAYAIATDEIEGIIEIVSINITDAANLIELDRLRVADFGSAGVSLLGVTNFSLEDNVLYASGSSGANYIIDVTDPAHLILKGFIPDPLGTPRARGVVIGERWLFGAQNGYIELDLNYENPVVFDDFVDFFLAFELATADDLVAVYDQPDLELYRSGANGSLELLNVLRVFGVTAVEIEMPYLYLAGTSGIQIYDVTDPTALVLTGEYIYTNSAFNVDAMCVSDGLVYALRRQASELIAIDASDPANAIATATLGLQPDANLLAKDCTDVLYIAGTSGYEAFDVETDGRVPAKLGDYTLPVDQVRGFDVGNGLLSASGQTTFVARLSSSGAVTEGASISVAAAQVRVDDGFVYLATDQEGMVLLTLDDEANVSVELSVQDIGVDQIAITASSVIGLGDSKIFSYRKAVQEIP